jgi:hypothetical protein
MTTLFRAGAILGREWNSDWEMRSHYVVAKRTGSPLLSIRSALGRTDLEHVA